MEARRRVAFRWAFLIVGTTLGLLWTSEARARSGVPEAAQAVAFVRVLGDLSLNTTDRWGRPRVLQDRELATGSAFVIAPSGLLVTTHHLVAGGRQTVIVDGVPLEVTLEVERVEVTLRRDRDEVTLRRERDRDQDHETLQAEVLHSDAERDLAFLQVTSDPLPHLPLGDSDAAWPGQRVTVLGFPFGRAVELGRAAGEEVVPDPTVTGGTVSAARFDDDGFRRYLQTDASVHPGNSGGPMIDDEGLVVGVVSLKLAPSPSSQGLAFGIPINMVKELLDRNGLLFLVPGTRLREGGIHELGWKGLSLNLPDGATDQSEKRLRVDTRDSASPVSFAAGRVVSRQGLGSLEKDLLRGFVFPDLFPTPSGSARRIPPTRDGRLAGSVLARGRQGGTLRVEYALLEVGSGGEKIVARFLGPEEDVSFNLGLLRASLASLEAVPLLTDEVRGPVIPAFVPTPFGRGNPGMVLPRGWIQEPATDAACVRVPPAVDGVSARPPGDFTVAFHALRFVGPGVDPEQVARACGQPKGTPELAYSRRYRKLGVDTGIWGVFRRWGTEVVLLEVEAPQSKLPFVRDLYVEWLQRVAP